MEDTALHLALSIVTTIGVGVMILSVRMFLHRQAHPVACGECGCAQADHMPEFGMGGACRRCRKCARFEEPNEYSRYRA